MQVTVSSTKLEGFKEKGIVMQSESIKHIELDLGNISRGDNDWKELRVPFWPRSACH